MLSYKKPFTKEENSIALEFYRKLKFIDEDPKIQFPKVEYVEKDKPIFDDCFKDESFSEEIEIYTYIDDIKINKIITIEDYSSKYKTILNSILEFIEYVYNIREHIKQANILQIEMK